MADNCVDIQLERIRAYIQVGQFYYVTTGTDDNAAGYIMSFSINKSRGQNIATFRCQLSVWLDAQIQSSLQTTSNNVGQKIVVHAGVGEKSDPSLPRLFTGYVTGLTQDPHWEDARKFILNVSGEDEFTLMKYGSKFSRRFKYGDDAFAVITGGKRREGGRMTKLRRVPAGRKGIDGPATGSNSSLEHSPLIRTPDPQGHSPSAAAPSGGGSKPESTSGGLTVSSQHNYAKEGDVVDILITDKNGIPVDPNSLKNTQGVRCLCCCNPPPSAFTKGSSTTKAEGMKEGEKTYPVSVQYITKNNLPYFRFTMTGAYPSKVTFIHPLTAETATINFHVIPPHGHRDLNDGGPAAGSFDSFQV
jgi:hypothetical protein